MPISNKDFPSAKKNNTLVDFMEGFTLILIQLLLNVKFDKFYKNDKEPRTSF